ncbi:hypothetical protein [Enterococcus casseliflavus]|uniref:hypothetical protein n=1 Tax=Enterococcus casseliflavus TaxID=37734 RepID=UPI0003FF99C5|nr:hypothetical protein [Enterococcus casseliflavus]
MAETTNTVKIGLDNWEVAKLDETDRVIGEPTRIPGLTSAQLALILIQVLFKQMTAFGRS